MTLRVDSVRELTETPLAGVRRFSVQLWDDGHSRTYDFELHVDAVAGGLIHGDDALQRDYQYQPGVEGLVGRSVGRFASGEALTFPLIVVDDNSALRVA